MRWVSRRPLQQITAGPGLCLSCCVMAPALSPPIWKKSWKNTAINQISPEKIIFPPGQLGLHQRTNFRRPGPYDADGHYRRTGIDLYDRVSRHLQRVSNLRGEGYPLLRPAENHRHHPPAAAADHPHPGAAPLPCRHPRGPAAGLAAGGRAHPGHCRAAGWGGPVWCR